mmetsp:Transcript_28050/g.90241  ORF Transcript_28050/g.90241 Transcript_28050/m.90241 type:complete len:262 (-) Transcript_28050:175-960(-)
MTRSQRSNPPRSRRWLSPLRRRPPTTRPSQRAKAAPARRSRSPAPPPTWVGKCSSRTPSGPTRHAKRRMGAAGWHGSSRCTARACMSCAFARRARRTCALPSTCSSPCTSAAQSRPTTRPGRSSARRPAAPSESNPTSRARRWRPPRSASLCALRLRACGRPTRGWASGRRRRSRAGTGPPARTIRRRSDAARRRTSSPSRATRKGGSSCEVVCLVWRLQLRRCLWGGVGAPEAPCAAQQCGNGAPALLVSISTDFPNDYG